MIKKAEIDKKAHELDVHTSDVQRDYIFGWLLSGIFSPENELKERLVLKGGNAFRKTYFEHARFSNDLDFGTKDSIDPIKLKEELNKACGYVQERTGINFATDKTLVKPKRCADDKDNVYDARVYFRGFYGEESYDLRVKLDVQQFDTFFLPIQQRNIVHAYSDAENCTGQVSVIKLEELMSLKLKALLQRQYSPDLYDFVYGLLFQETLDIDKKEIVEAFLKRTIYEPNPAVAKGLLLDLPFQVMKGFWNRYIVCPTQSMIKFDDAVKSFNTLVNSVFELAPAGYYGRLRGVEYFPSEYRTKIMEAGRKQVYLKMQYDGLDRFIEPYSLKYTIRNDNFGREYLWGWDPSGGRSGKVSIKRYTQDKITSLEITDRKFDPRYDIEVSKAGDLGDDVKPKPERDVYSVSRKSRRITSTYRRRAPAQAKYVIQCGVCLKEFRRAKHSLRINKHKDRFGNPCYGRSGYIVRYL